MHAAAFVDFENLFQSLKNREELSGHRIRDLCLSILEHLKARLAAENAPLVFGRSYAAFDTYPGMEVAHDLALMGFDPQYVLTGQAGKNSADVQLACDVCRVLYRRPDIDAIVIVSGDRDFIPVARQVLEENRELRVVAIPDSTSGDLRMRVGGERFWNALDLIGGQVRNGQAPAAIELAAAEDPPAPAAAPDGPKAETDGNGSGSVGGAGGGVPVAGDAPERAAGEARRAPRASIVGHIPVTWRTADEMTADAEFTDRLHQCLDLILRSQARHGSPEVWLSPFLKGPMSQHFSGLVHPERRAMINELRQRGAIRIEERENQYADHPYSVIVLENVHPMVQAALERGKRRDEVKAPQPERGGRSAPTPATPVTP
ncbi:MAG: NYN domain-containing protein [Planctomycetes bacterium]|nr:NYN domain-containing protein [Planctomycetota bacterium]